MTPKEKAFKLLERFRLNVLDYEGASINTHKAKQCAIIAVDEIMKTYPSKNGIALYENQINDFEYWQRVKKEIENL